MSRDDFDEDDGPPDTSEDLIHCPECKAQIYAEAQRCPECGHWVVSDDGRDMVWSPRRSRAMKLIAVGILILIALSLAAIVIETILKS